jgi:hypothetical protein
MFTRDPMSVRFDRQARLAISLAIDQHRKHAQNRRLVRYIRVRIDTPAALWFDRDKGGLTRVERAFQRALYYDDRIHNANPYFHPDADWSLKVEWDPQPLVPGTQRSAKLTIFGDTEAARHVERTYTSGEKFVEGDADRVRGGVA